ncbi:hypothetical protein BT96DRAFT_1020218 [Gymnopus androsaceus JB14]|uniref:Lipoyl-binding domain-containing protein n=1 Tax=Gymnopus androsaceus JB14 TaxID=1447944 RepID=A0A6A4HKY2_9AGAR|nr:hypothetical protein BT96DRAFT_1020218 [Gymnopus androsaceus JB14]
MSTTSSVLVQRVNSLSRAARNTSFSTNPRVRQQSFHESRATQAIMMPALSPFMTEGTITKWLKKEGETFAAGDVLLQIESDLACLDVQAEMPGVMGKILIPDGTSNVPVEQVLAVVARDTQEVTRLRPPTPRLRHIPPPLARLDIPPTPIRNSRGYPEIPTPISATSFYTAPLPAAESPSTTTALRRPSLHFHHPLSTASRLESSQSNASFLHSATHRSPTGYDASGDSFIHQGGGAAASVRGMIMDHHHTACPSAGLCDSASTVGCEGSHSRAQVEVSGQALNLRRKILASFSSKVLRLKAMVLQSTLMGFSSHGRILGLVRIKPRGQYFERRTYCPATLRRFPQLSFSLSRRQYGHWREDRSLPFPLCPFPWPQLE